jgi:hypothetical protein
VGPSWVHLILVGALARSALACHLGTAPSIDISRYCCFRLAAVMAMRHAAFDTQVVDFVFLLSECVGVPSGSLLGHSLALFRCVAFGSALSIAVLYCLIADLQSQCSSSVRARQVYSCVLFRYERTLVAS